MDEFVTETKHERHRKLNPNPPCEKKSEEMSANYFLSVLDINYVTYTRKCV